MSSDQLAPLVADLHLLTVLAATQSFTETARRLGLSKASVSSRISDLERTAGLTLVRRTTRSVGLTEAGQQLVDELQPAFSRILDGYSSVRDLVGAPRGLIRVTAPVALGRQHLAPCVASFLRQFPEITIELDLTDRFVNLPAEGFDLAIRHTNTPPETHRAWALCRTRSVLLASADYVRQRGLPLHPSDLAAHDCLLYLSQTGKLGQTGRNHSATWLFEKKPQAKKSKAGSPVGARVSVAIKGRLKANNSEVLREALLAGLGIGLLPDFSAPAGHGLVEVLPDWQVQGFFGEDIYALRAWSPQVPKAVQCFVAHLQENFAAGFASAVTGCQN
jgi:DNA-binding transcriptional LysR family regulator